jgi:hypothetical protein
MSLRLPTTLIALVVYVSVAIACEPFRPIWAIDDKRSADPLYRFMRNGKAGYIDRNGKIVISPRFDEYNNLDGEFHNGRLAIRWGADGYVDTTGRTVTPAFGSGSDFSEGLASVALTSGGARGYIDTGGRMVIQPRFEKAEAFSERLAAVMLQERVGYIDRSGALAIDAKFFEGTSFTEERAWVIVEGPCRWRRVVTLEELEAAPAEGVTRVTLGDSCSGSYARPTSQDKVLDLIPCRYALIDKQGNVISERRFDDALGFSEGLAPVLIGNRWGYVDRQGVTVIQPQFIRAYRFSEGRARVMTRSLTGDWAYGYIDRSGAYVVPPQLDAAEDFSEGVAAVLGDSGWFYMDAQGRRALKGTFVAAGSFFQGIAHVQLSWGSGQFGGRYEYIRRDGTRVFTYQR